MVKKEAQSLGKCAECGANMDLVGRSHNCKPRPLGTTRTTGPVVMPERKAQAKQSDGSIEHPVDRRKREIEETVYPPVIAKKTTMTVTEAGTFIDEEASIPDAVFDKRLAKTQPAALRRQEGEARLKGLPLPTSVEVVQAAADAIIEKHGHNKNKLTIRIDRDLMKELKIDAIDQGLTIEAWVEQAIRQELKARRA